jgi:glycosidase
MLLPCLRDPEVIAFWPHGAGRDGARTPMPWTITKPLNAGSDDLAFERGGYRRTQRADRASLDLRHGADTAQALAIAMDDSAWRD